MTTFEVQGSIESRYFDDNVTIRKSSKQLSKMALTLAADDVSGEIDQREALLFPPPGTGEGGPQPRAGLDAAEGGAANGDSAGHSKVEEEGDGDDNEDDSGNGKAEGDDNEDNSGDGRAERGQDQRLDSNQVTARLAEVDKKLGDLGHRSTILTNLVGGLRESLEFSQKEMEELKAENRELRQKVNDLETEESRSAYQMNKLDEKVDRVDTHSRRKNLIFEGVPEEGGKEDVCKTIWKLFDQLNINAGIDFDACYRQGNYNASRTRPIVISFLKQTDRGSFTPAG